MVEELEPELEIGTIRLEPGEAFYYTAWGIHYRFRPTDEWMIAQISFRKRSDAEGWMKEYYLRLEGMEGEVVPVKSCLLLEARGNIKNWVEELS